MNACRFSILVLASTLWAVGAVGTSHAQQGRGYGPAIASPGSIGDPYAAVAPTQFVPGAFVPGSIVPGQYASPGGGLGGWTPGAIWQPAADSIANRLWLRADYLYWWTDGMDTPALVTTSPAGTPRNQAGVLGFAPTSTLFGGGEINDDATNGVRGRVGLFLNQSGAFGIEGEYFGLQEQDDGFNRSGSGAVILARPFYDTNNDRQTAQLTAFPGVVEGNLRIDSTSQLQSFLVNGRVSLCPNCGLNCNGCNVPDRTDWIVGYRRLTLEDSLTFRENLNSLVTNAPGTIALQESFRTENTFNGVQLGVVHQTNFRRAWLESMLRVAAGNNTQTVRIAGQSVLTELGVSETFPGGLLAQRTNIGTYERDQFVLIPEVGLTLGIRLTDWLDATVGYTAVYLPNVVRAGSQIDTDLNPNLIPEETVPFSGGLRPGFRFIQSDYIAHGLSVGGEIRF